jgi:hypothetical protein
MLDAMSSPSEPVILLPMTMLIQGDADVPAQRCLHR